MKIRKEKIRIYYELSFSGINFVDEKISKYVECYKRFFFFAFNTLRT